MTLLEQWRIKAYGNELDQRSRDMLWNDYFAVEKGIYERILKEPSKVYEGTIDELAAEFGTDRQTMVGFLDGINESLKGYENPIDTMDETTVVKIEIDPERLYYNMVGAKADWLYNLPQWNDIFSEEERKALYLEEKKSGTIVKDKKIGRNDPCPCGSGKKYKHCCGKNK